MDAAGLPLAPAGARRVHVGPERLARWLVGFGDRHGDVAVTATAERVHLSGGDGAQCWIDVPFPPQASGGGGGGGGGGEQDPLGALVAHALAYRTVGVVLVRRGGYAAGVFGGTELVASKVGSSYVQGTTKAGGWSQQRYARRRSNQSRDAFAEAADVTARILLPRVHDLDGVIGGGDRAAVTAVLADHRLAPLQARLVPPFLAVPNPRLRVLVDSADQWRAVTIRLWP